MFDSLIRIGDIIPFRWVSTAEGKTLASVQEYEDGDETLVISQNRDDLKKEGRYRVDAIDFDFQVPIRNKADGHFTGGITYGYCAKLSLVA